MINEISNAVAYLGQTQKNNKEMQQAGQEKAHTGEVHVRDVVEVSDAPIVATHSCAHAVCPLTRNLTDKQLDAIKESGGMVGLIVLEEPEAPEAEAQLDAVVETAKVLAE